MNELSHRAAASPICLSNTNDDRAANAVIARVAALAKLNLRPFTHYRAEVQYESVSRASEPVL